jgi:hypothetical protein
MRRKLIRLGWRRNRRTSPAVGASDAHRAPGGGVPRPCSDSWVFRLADASLIAGEYVDVWEDAQHR